MSKTVRTVALFAVLGMAFSGCQKENVSVFPSQMTESETIRVVGYSVDCHNFRVELRGEKAWQEFLENMRLLAQEGHKVAFWNGNGPEQDSVSKETLTYTTSNEKDAKEWCAEKYDLGYKVGMTYDSKTGVYVCVAIK